VAKILHGMGARVTVYDPAALPNARRVCLELEYADTLAEAAHDAHVVLLLTEWSEFAGLTPSSLSSVVARHNIVDGRNVLDPVLWRDAGWTYRALGDGKGRSGFRRDPAVRWGTPAAKSAVDGSEQHSNALVTTQPEKSKLESYAEGRRSM
jgi:UDP-glucose/GDP-mannose dehydrogenase family, UDP binding domain